MVMLGMPPFDMMHPTRYAPTHPRARNGFVDRHYSAAPIYEPVQKRVRPPTQATPLPAGSGELPVRASAAGAPYVDKRQTKEEYIVQVRAPAGMELRNTQARLESNGSVVRLTGEVVPPATTKYMLVRRALVFASPRRNDAIGVLPAGTVVLGVPSRSGWVQLADEEGWLQDDGYSLSPLAAPRPAKAFERTFQVPHDGKSEEATCSTTTDGFVVIVPRHCPAMMRAATIPPEPAAAPSKPAAAAAAQPKPAAAAADPSKSATASTAATSSPRTEHPKSTASGRSASRAPVRDVLTEARQPPKRDPVLVERSASLSNVQHPEESCEDWAATSMGGFVLVGTGKAQT